MLLGSEELTWLDLYRVQKQRVLLVLLENKNGLHDSRDHSN